MNYNRNQTSVNSRPSYATIGLLIYVKLQVINETSYPWIQKHKRIVGSSLHTRLKALTMAMQELSLIEKAETVQVHFTLGGEGPKKSLWMKSLHGVQHGRLWIRVHGLS